MSPWVIAAGIWACGSLVAWSAIPRRGSRCRDRAVWVVGLGPALGFGLVSLVEFFSRYLFDSRATLTVHLASFGVIAGVAFLLRLREGSTSEAEAPPVAPWRSGHFAMLGVTLCVLAGTLTVFWQELDTRPGGAWDAQAIWLPRALTISRSPGDAGHVIREMKLGHPEYPLMLPGAMAAMFQTLGEEDDAVPQVVALAFLLGLAVLLYATITRGGSRYCALSGVALLLSVPFVVLRSSSLYADVPMSYLFLAALAAMASCLGGRPPRIPVWLIGFLLALPAWMKQEGAVMAGVLLIAFLIVQWRWVAGGRRLRRFMILASGALPPVLALVAFKTSWSGDNLLTAEVASLPDLLFDPSRWQVTWEFWWGMISTDGFWHWSQEAGVFNREAYRWGSTWLALLVVLVLLASWRRLFTSRRLCFMGLAVFGLIAAYFLLYVTIPLKHEWHLKTSAGRLFLQFLPALVAFAFSLIRLEVEPSGAPESPPIVGDDVVTGVMSESD